MAVLNSLPWIQEDAGTDLRLLFENAPMGMAQCDRHGTVLAMNPALTTLLAGKLQSAGHGKFHEFLAPENRELVEEIFPQLMSGQRTSFQAESCLGCGDETTWLRWIAWGVCGGAHTPDCVLFLAEDITQRHNLEERSALEERLQTLGRMAGGIAHDFNNLLTGVLLYCDLMLHSLEGTGGAPDPHAATEGIWPQRDRLRHYVEEIRSAGMQATGVVQQLLSVMRPRDTAVRALSWNATVEGMRNLLTRLIGKKIDLCFHLDPNLNLASMDSAQAQQVLLNLTLNARDAMPEGGRIDVETANCTLQIFREGGSGGEVADIHCVLLVVSDNGDGMEEETRQRALHPYFTTKAGGNGIGLATVQNLVAGRGGLVQVESVRGQGTRVRVLLPAVRAPSISTLPGEEWSHGAA